MFIFGSSLWGQSSNEIIGTWWTYYDQKKSGKVEVYQVGDEYRGKIVYLADNKNPDGTSPKLDNFNPNKALRSRILKGTTILTGLKWNRDVQEWSGGNIYNTKSGKTYSCFAKIQENGSLYFKGYLGGLRFIGRSTIWTRVN